MNRRPDRRVLWLVGAAALLAAVNVVDHFFLGDDAPGLKPGRSTPPAAATAPQSTPAAAPPGAPKRIHAVVAAPQSVQVLRERLEHLRSVEKSAAEVRQAYAKVAIPYAEAMAFLPTYFRAGSDPKAAIEGAVRGLAARSGVEVDSLLAATPQRVGPGVFEGLAKVTARAGDSGAMLRFFAEAGRPENGMIWNGFQLSADAQNKQLSLAGELRVLLVESAE